MEAQDARARYRRGAGEGLREARCLERLRMLELGDGSGGDASNLGAVWTLNGWETHTHEMMQVKARLQNNYPRGGNCRRGATCWCGDVSRFSRRPARSFQQLMAHSTPGDTGKHPELAQTI